MSKYVYNLVENCLERRKKREHFWHLLFLALAATSGSPFLCNGHTWTSVKDVKWKSVPHRHDLHIFQIHTYRTCIKNSSLSCCTGVCRTFFYHIPNFVLTNKNWQSVSKFLNCLFDTPEVKLLKTAAYHLQTTGQIEWYNRTVFASLLRYMNKQHFNWDLLVELLPYPKNEKYNYVQEWPRLPVYQVWNAIHSPTIPFSSLSPRYAAPNVDQTAPVPHPTSIVVPVYGIR